MDRPARLGAQLLDRSTLPPPAPNPSNEGAEGAPAPSILLPAPETMVVVEDEESDDDENDDDDIMEAAAVVEPTSSQTTDASVPSVAHPEADVEMTPPEEAPSHASASSKSRLENILAPVLPSSSSAGPSTEHQDTVMEDAEAVEKSLAVERAPSQSSLVTA